VDSLADLYEEKDYARDKVHFKEAIAEDREEMARKVSGNCLF
jgi:hypothetical protein